MALTNLGVLLARTNRTPEALQTFERVLTIEPNHGQAIYNLAALYLAKKEYPRAIQLLEKSAGGSPESSDDLGLLLKLADAYAHAGRAAEASRLSLVIEKRAAGNPGGNHSTIVPSLTPHRSTDNHNNKLLF